MVQEKEKKKRPRIFVRGSVWHWDDPICQTKDKNIKVPDGESTQRYSRYVLVIQNTDTIDEPDIIDDPKNGNDTNKKTTPDIMVIPLTTTDKGRFSVPITISHGYKKTNITHAYVKRSFTVDVRQLSNFQCFISDEDMMKIEEKILELNGISSRVEKLVEKNLDTNKKFYKSINTGDSPVLNYVPTGEPVDETPTEKVVHQESETKTIEASNRKGGRGKKGVYTRRYMQSFVKLYKENKEKCAKKYNYAPSSAYRHYLNFRKELEKLDEESKDKSSVTQADEASSQSFGTNIGDIANSISNLSNRIRDEYKKLNFSQNLHSAKSKTTTGDFYQDFQNCVYFSFIELCGLKTYNGKISGIEINSNLHIPMFRFLEVYWTDKNLNKDGEFSDLVKTIKDEGGYIEKGFLTILSNMMLRKMSLTSADRRKVIDHFKQYCLQD